MSGVSGEVGVSGVSGEVGVSGVSGEVGVSGEDGVSGVSGEGGVGVSGEGDGVGCTGSHEKLPIVFRQISSLKHRFAPGSHSLISGKHTRTWSYCCCRY